MGLDGTVLAENRIVLTIELIDLGLVALTVFNFIATSEMKSQLCNIGSSCSESDLFVTAN